MAGPGDPADCVTRPRPARPRWREPARHRLRARAFGAVAGAFGIVVMLASPAWAHAVPVSSRPADGAVIATLPPLVSVTFDEAVQPVPAGIAVYGPSGQRVSTGLLPSAWTATIRVALRHVRAGGTYTFQWRAISDDGHPVAGVVMFSVGHPSRPRTPAAAPGGTSTAVPVLFALARLAAYAGFAVLAGAVAFCCYADPTAARLRGLQRLIVAGWWAAAAGTLGSVLLQGPYAAGASLAGLAHPGLLTGTLASRYGAALVSRLAILGLAPVVACWALPRIPGTRRGRAGVSACWAALVIAMAATWSVAGHAGDGGQRVTALLADGTHLCAMALWLGGLAAVVIVVRARADDALEAALRFSAVAAACVSVLAATGVYLGWLRVRTLPALVTTGYGLTLLAKVTLVAAIVAAALFSRRRLHQAAGRPGESAAAGGRPPPAAGDSRRALLQLMTVEAAGALAVLAITSVLVEELPAAQAVAARDHRLSLAPGRANCYT